MAPTIARPPRTGPTHLAAIDPDRDRQLRIQINSNQPDEAHRDPKSEQLVPLARSPASPSSSDYFNYLRTLRSVWSDLPSLRVEWRDLSFTFRVPITEQPKDLAHSFLAVSSLFRPTPKRDFHALHPIDGVLLPGSSTLVLAPPGAGKSFLLKALSGQLSGDQRLRGDLRWNGLTAEQLANEGWKLRRLCHYLDQGDIHLALSTVKETFQFALDSAVADPALLQSSSSSSSSLTELQRLHSQKVDLLLGLLSLRECSNTILGNDLIRGVSGGQRKRVSVGEAMVTNARLFALDEITTGLDSSAAYDVNNALVQWARIMDGIFITALLQPTPEIYNLFDNVILLQEGSIVYSGPRNQVMPYVQSLGFECPHDVDEADFLVEWLTQPKRMWQRQKRKQARREKKGLETQPSAPNETETDKRNRATEDQNVNTESNSLTHHVTFHNEDFVQPTVLTNGVVEDEGRKAEETHTESIHLEPAVGLLANSKSNSQSIPFTTSELVERYRSSPFYASLSTALSSSSSSSHPNLFLSFPSPSRYTIAQFRDPFSHSFFHHVRLCLDRQKTVMGRNAGFIGPRIGQSVVMGLLIGSLFYQSNPSNFTAKIGLFLFTVVFLAFANMAELPVASEAKSTVYKQHDARLYPTLSYVFSVSIVHLTVVIPETIIFGSILYFMSGAVLEAGRFFFYLLVIFCCNIAMASYFRFCAYVTTNPDIAQQLAGPSTAFQLLFGGFLITQDKIPKWLLEFFYLSPFSWALRSLTQNEFFASEYDDVQFNDATNSYRRVGDTYLSTYQISLDPQYKWAGVGYLLGFFLVCSILSAFILSSLRFPLTVGTRRRDEPTEPEAAAAASLPHHHATVGATFGAGDLTDTQPAGMAAVGKFAIARQMSLGDSSKVQAVSSLPFTPMNLSFRNLKYTIQVPDPANPKAMIPRILLDNINGYSLAGTLTALMGSSGAGKTTLMDVIAGRKTSGIVEGEILVNGHPKVDDTFRRICGYVEQQDYHTGTATVRDALEFSARLRLAESVSDAARKAFVEEVMEILELAPLAERRIGDSTDLGLSPGQLKLVTIGVELVSNPSILFLDEPTSGLDSRAALVVMRVLKRVAQTGRAVICTIHQPSSELFYFFDRLLLLRSGGFEVFFGDVGESGSELVEYFETAPVPAGYQTPKLPPRTNPASWMLDVIGSGSGAGRAADYVTIYRESELRKKNLFDIGVISTPPAGSHPLQFDTFYTVSYWTQLKTVTYRFFESHYRNTSYNLTRWLISVFQGVVFGLIYLQINASDQAGLISKFSCIFMAVGTVGVTNCASAVPVLYRARAVFYREQASLMYSTYVYSFGMGLVELPYVFIGCFVFLAPFYFLVGYQNDANLFFQFLLGTFLVAMQFNRWGQFLVSSLPNILVIGILQGVSFSFLFLFAGVFIAFPLIPVGWTWVYYLDFIPKGLVPIASSQFECGENCDTVSITTGGSPQLETPQDFVNNVYLGRGTGIYWPWIGYSVLEYFVLSVMVVLAVAKINHLKR